VSHPTRVGILGCGGATQAIHLPVLSTMTDSLEVTRVTDVQGDLATQVASRCDARASTDARDIIDDTDIDVIVICSRHGLHAEQVVASCAAGKPEAIATLKSLVLHKGAMRRAAGHTHPLPAQHARALRLASQPCALPGFVSAQC
jgi:predicted dinucleotide-utilizing enzyme